RGRPGRGRRPGVAGRHGRDRRGPRTPLAGRPRRSRVAARSLRRAGSEGGQVGVVETYRGLLRNGPLTRLLAGEVVSWVRAWLYLVALVVLVYRETGDPIVLGIVGAARLLPYIVLSIPAGAIADRFDRRLVLLASDLARAACMLVMAALVAFGWSIWLVAAV